MNGFEINFLLFRKFSLFETLTNSGDYTFSVDFGI